ncbi:40S ribosomal protein S11 [Thelohanellus kitauei]|uniref:Small ribosomal subunit protein uS17 n=1 Tax=Thelohanellus kitauei TaxID=669202 RepID=A0A0C2N5R4_THEKT|nr:40S ribosomal protein S11 [Thelohanellus kitauei]
MIHEQTEKAFQKQKNVFLNKKSQHGDVPRFVRNIGLDFKTPKEAKEIHYIDKKCPFTGNVSIRGRILTGKIVSLKMKHTCVVRREYLHFVQKYKRYERRHKNISSHISPAFINAKVGDSVVIGECRPLSKTVRFNVVKVNKPRSSRKIFSKY